MERATNANTGDVFQLVNGGAGDSTLARWPYLRGLLVYADEIRHWGIVAMAIETVSAGGVRYVPLRLQWDEIEYVGTPKVIPEGVGR